MEKQLALDLVETEAVTRRKIIPARQRRIPREIQPWIFGLEPGRISTFFFATCPDAAAKEKITRIAWNACKEPGLSARPLKEELLHITLCGLWASDGPHSDNFARAIDAAGSIRMPPFDVCFRRALSFRRNDRDLPFVLCAGKELKHLYALRSSLDEAAARVGFKRAGAFTPHVTMLYGSRSLTEREIEPVYWKVRDFVLIESLQGQRRHIHRGAWLLSS